MLLKVSVFTLESMTHMDCKHGQDDRHVDQLPWQLVSHQGTSMWSLVNSVFWTGEGRAAGVFGIWGQTGGCANFTQHAFCSHQNGIAEIFEGNPITQQLKCCNNVLTVIFPLRLASSRSARAFRKLSLSSFPALASALEKTTTQTVRNVSLYLEKCHMMP